MSHEPVNLRCKSAVQWVLDTPLFVSTRFALRLQQWRVLSLLGRGTVRPHDLIVVEKLGMAIADGVQFVSARNGFEIRLKDDVAPADVDGYKVARLPSAVIRKKHGVRVIVRV